MRVLDLDLDFFMQDICFDADYDDPRLDDAAWPAQPLADVMAYLKGNLGLTGRLPGTVFEHHGDIFKQWRRMIGLGVLQTPFHLTHVDAHADLGLGDDTYPYLLNEIMARDPQYRQEVLSGERHLTDGSFIPFAVACRWISAIDYVHHPAGGYDVPVILLEGFDPDADAIQLARLSNPELEQLQRAEPTAVPTFRSQEPRVPLRTIPGPFYLTEEPFDFIFLTRSPSYTSRSADPIFDAIKDAFIDEDALRGLGL